MSVHLNHFIKWRKTHTHIRFTPETHETASYGDGVTYHSFIDFKQTKNCIYCDASVLCCHRNGKWKIRFNCNLQMRYFCIMKRNAVWLNGSFDAENSVILFSCQRFFIHHITSNLINVSQSVFGWNSICFHLCCFFSLVLIPQLWILLSNWQKIGLFHMWDLSLFFFC